MKISYWIGLFLPLILLWWIASDSQYLYPNLGVVILFLAYASAVHELCSHLPKSQVHAQILLRLLSAAAVLWYFHLTGLSLAAVLVIAITFTIWDFYQVANRVNP